MKEEMGTVTCRISQFSDEFYSCNNYAGAIIYGIDGQFQWQNLESGQAYGYKGRSFYIIIQCTDNWPEENLKAAGQGRVQDYLLKNVLGIDYDQDRVACGGFSYVDGELKFSSVWLNARNQTGAESDGSKYLSDLEVDLVKFCFDQYKEYGASHMFELSWAIDENLLARDDELVISDSEISTSDDELSFNVNGLSINDDESSYSDDDS
ncbi:unnamed protein product [Rotaria socialis]|nr:unnamed protein product [Rotaria socialis]